MLMPHQIGTFFINVVIHVICIIPFTTTDHNIHQSKYQRENSFNSYNENSYTTSSQSESLASLPYFLKIPTTVSVIEGSAVILSCRIESLGDRMVFWIRNSDLQILTAGLVTFTADNRFKVNHENSIDSTDWSLLITDVTMADQGLYECQINTEPKMKMNINLIVKEFSELMEMDSPFSGAMIEGKNINILKKGSTITLTCKVMENGIEGNSANTRRIEWMKNGKLVKMKTRHGGVTIDTVWHNKSGTSKLILGELEDEDSGNYSCSSNGFESEQVLLHVVSNLKGDAAEISTRNNGSTQKF
ncbi:CLUMA_CG012607, isoform A [Clunio marinus]|uniref:CLUMA_CG012607, isoform A n=1 Tax=Clunio marinus TaxID=568069 RepID=A0A1J1IJQ9_9DIPT|nr:CLUMA_CG012607, isoform A [Clunio marinus]